MVLGRPWELFAQGCGVLEGTWAKPCPMLSLPGQHRGLWVIAVHLSTFLSRAIAACTLLCSQTQCVKSHSAASGAVSRMASWWPAHSVDICPVCQNELLVGFLEYLMPTGACIPHWAVVRLGAGRLGFCLQIIPTAPVSPLEQSDTTDSSVDVSQGHYRPCGYVFGHASD